MKSIVLLPLLLLQLFAAPVFSQVIKGKVVDNNGRPVPHATVRNADTDSSTTTDVNGDFQIAAVADQDLQILKAGYEPFKLITLSGYGLDKPLVFIIERNQDVAKNLGALSAESYWVGAKLGYNFDGFSEDGTESFIGAAKILINAAERNTELTDPVEIERSMRRTWGVIGNVSDFISNQNREDATKNLQNIALSVQGFGAGLYFGYILNKNLGDNFSIPRNVLRAYATTGYRLNTFKNVGADSATVNLSQLRTSGGLEFEGGRFGKGGKLNLSCEVSYSLFDKNRYQQVFNEEKSGLISCELNVIIPLNDTFGFYSSGTFAPSMSAVYQLGIIIRQSN